MGNVTKIKTIIVSKTYQDFIFLPDSNGSPGLSADSFDLPANAELLSLHKYLLLGVRTMLIPILYKA